MVFSPALRVLYVINGLGTGGAERSFLELTQPLRDRGVSLEVVCLFDRSEGVAELISDQLRVEVLGSSSWFGRWRSLRRRIVQGQFDLVHTSIFESDVLGRSAAIGTGTPVLSSIVNMSYDTARTSDPRVRPWRLKVTRMIDGWTARHLTARVHVLTRAVGESVQDHLGVDADRISVVGRGRSQERLGEPSPERRQRVRASLGLDNDQSVLLTVGRQEYQKGQRFLIEAMPLILAEHPNTRLLIAGREGSVSRELEAAIQRLELSSAITLLGHREDVGDLLAASDIFAFPSLFEGFGGAMLEAMAMGIPVVASDLPPLREVAGEGGAFLVPASSAFQLSEGMRTLLNDPMLADRLGQRGQQRFREQYTIEAIADRMAELYRSVIRTGRY